MRLKGAVEKGVCKIGLKTDRFGVVLDRLISCKPNFFPSRGRRSELHTSKAAQTSG
jgi:hypothetical protein